jgi:hypothetical protein
MNKYKRILIVISIFTIVSIISVAVYATNEDFRSIIEELTLFSNAQRAIYIVEDFDLYYDDFQTIADVAKRYEDGNDQPRSNFLLSGYANGVDYLSDHGHRIELSDQELKSLINLQKAFKCKDANFIGIRLHGNRIAFETNNGHYTLVYSIDDSEPTYVNSPEENWEIYVTKIRNNWYHVVKNPG